MLLLRNIFSKIIQKELFYAESEAEKDSWITQLNEAIAVAKLVNTIILFIVLVLIRLLENVYWYTIKILLTASLCFFNQTKSFRNFFSD